MVHILLQHVQATEFEASAMTQIFCVDDIVARKSNETLLAVVERTHGDVDTHDPHPGRSDRVKCDKDIKKAAFAKFMKDGVPPKDTVVVRWQSSNSAQLILESKLEVVDRSLLIGDVVKKSVRDAMSGVIINTFTKCTLQPMSDVILSDHRQSNSVAKLKAIPPSTAKNSLSNQISLNKTARIVDVPASEIKYEGSPTPEDLVIYKDSWIGRVEDFNIMIALRLSDNCVVEIKDDLAEHLDGSYDVFSVGDVAACKKAVLRTGKWIYGKYNPNTMPIGTVVQTRLITADISWLERRIGIGGDGTEPPPTLERTELESAEFQIYDRTRRPQKIGTGDDPRTVSNSEIDVRLNLRVRFKDLSGACVKYDGSNGNAKITRIDRKDSLGYDLNVFDVCRFHTDVTVQWQDLSITRERSIDLIPEITIDDDHDAWPGEIAHPLDLEPVLNLSGVRQAKKVGVIQSVNASERMANIAWCPNGCVQYSEDLIDVPGIRGLVTAVVGSATGEHDEVSLYDVEAPGELNVRRGDIVLIPKPMEGSSNDEIDQDWLGEIVDTRLDGSLTVRLGAASPVRDVNLQRENVVVAIRSDMSDEVEAWEDESFPQVRINSAGEIEVASESEDASWDDDDDSNDSASLDVFLSSDSDEADVKYEDENGEPMDVEDVENDDWESDSGEDDDLDMANNTEQTPLTSQSATPPDSTLAKVGPEQIDDIVHHIKTDAPEPYLILDQVVPTSHAFSTRPCSDSATHMKRTQKEHKILRTSTNLPEGVYVRTWESRLDLLRVLFIGPEGTPYVNAPFIVDFYLPSTFPSEPPQAFFHSWTVDGGLGGVGRVNPNLYEDGKICLSLLGTWESGKGSEGWSAGRSTLLQVLVSLLGLVLVKEPYFNEAGYEHLAGMESARRASQLYSERTFLKARTFVLAALTRRTNDTDSRAGMGTEGLEEVLDWLYRASNGPGLLVRCVSAMEEILKSSENGSDEDGDGNVLPVMSKGACISLRRVLERFATLS